ncbi:villin-1 isoform X2 [Cornus florida]|nr:villin-1 isoform X2 [Cornus florida]
MASDKALELDAALGSHIVQYREVQGQESEKFLSYFKPCIIPVEGVFSVGPGDANGETYQVSLLKCKGDRVVHVKEVPFTRSSLNHNDVFILDTASKIFLFSGCNSLIQERAKALEVVQYIKENKHKGDCEIATIDDGKFVGDSDVGEFWSLFGGYAPIPRDSPSAVQEQPEFPTAKLFWITTQGQLCQCGTNTLNKEMLDTNKCYLLDCDTELVVWMGRNTSIMERKTSISAVEDFLRSQGRSVGTHLTFVTEGSETASFKSYFGGWPQTAEVKLYEEGREKVAAIFKQQGYDVRELPEEDCRPFIDCSGTLKVWLVNGDEVSLVPVVEQKKLFSGDCYVVQYTYPGYGRNGMEENLFYAWLGRRSVMEDRADAISNMNTIANSTKGDPVLAQIVEGREPIQFFSIFQTLIIYKGGMSKRYKRSMAEKSISDETYDDTKTALFRVQGTSSLNMQAIQVDLVSSSLNASHCYILKTETSIFSWIGNLSSTRDHDLLDRMLDLIDPRLQPVLVREGSEPDVFWNALSGKAEYPREKEIKGYREDPHLFSCTFTEGDFKVKEIFNFSQDDLTTEDVLVLDCHCDIYVWIGRHSHIKSKQQALTIGLKFLEKDILVEGLSLETPVYVVTEGYEPPFFTRFFEWDFSKANMLGNSFERKLAILKGKAQKMEAPLRSSRRAYSLETTPESLRSRSVTPNGIGRSLSPASGVSGASFRSSDTRRFSSPTPTTRTLFSGYSPDLDNADGLLVSTGSVEKVPMRNSEKAGILLDKQTENGVNLLIYPYERLKVISNDPVTGIDVTKREAYLSDEEFQEKFGMPKRDFYELPKWRRNKMKMSLHLF